MYISPNLSSMTKNFQDWSQRYFKWLDGTSSTPPGWIIPTTSAFKDLNLLGHFIRSHIQHKGYHNSMGLGLQIAILDAMERSFRSRHVSPVRAALMVASRHAGHSISQTNVHKDLIRYIQSLT